MLFRSSSQETTWAALPRIGLLVKIVYKRPLDGGVWMKERQNGGDYYWTADSEFGVIHAYESADKITHEDILRRYTNPCVKFGRWCAPALWEKVTAESREATTWP